MPSRAGTLSRKARLRRLRLKALSEEPTEISWLEHKQRQHDHVRRLEEMGAFDSLPKPLREAIARSAFGCDSRNYANALAEGARHFASMGVQATPEMLGAMLGDVIPRHEAAMLARHNAQQLAETGTEIPHVVAQATFQR
jgi:hypothetical protein